LIQKLTDWTTLKYVAYIYFLKLVSFSYWDFY